ncbi:MAG: ATPase [Oscillospiraceae bacterium]
MTTDMSISSVNEILNHMEDVIDASWNFPMMNGKCIVDAETLRDMLDDIRRNLPREIKQSNAIVSDRAAIISDAKKEYEAIVKKAEERARVLISQEEVVKQAHTKANEIMNNAQRQAKDVRNAAQDFSDNVLRQAEESLSRSLGDVRGTRQALKNARKK